MDGVNTRKRLGDLLVDEGVLTPQQVDELLSSRIEVDGRLERLGEAAVRLGFCSQDEIGMVLAQQMDLEYRDDHVLPVDAELASRTSRSLAERHLVMPLRAEDGDVVAVACVDPTNIVGLDDVRVAIGARRLRIVVVPTKTLRQTIQEAYGVEARAQQDDFFSAYRKEEEEAEEIEITATSENDGPIIKLADEIILRALTGGASDIHVEPRPDSIVVRNRIDGVLHETMNLPRQISGPLISRIKLIAGLDIAEKRKPQDGRAHFRGSDREEDAVDLRLSTLPTMFGESVVIRLLRRDNARLTPEDIGMSSAQAAQVLSAVERPQGLVLVTGPTGSGKTSTLYTFLQHLATEERKLITVEDPVEYELEGVVQSQVNERAGYTLNRALRTMLRQDPDIVMVGEIRDPETAELALHASLTGHLVLSTLHTNDAPSAVVRLAELGMPGYLIASALTMVMAQRLVRTVCPDCTREVPPNDRHRQRLSLPPDMRFVEGAGCNACMHSGYRGRAGVFEILTVDGPVRELIADNASTDAIAQAARASGLRGLREDAIHKAGQGMTTLDEVLRVTPRTEHAANHCPVCAQQVEVDFRTCPWCTADLRPNQCAQCERALDPAWLACPSCGTATGTTSGPVAVEGEGDPTTLPRILVVDDDPSVRGALQAMLAGDFEVVEADCGEAALAAVHASRFDAAVIDKGLPDLDGYAVTREIRARPTVRDLPIMIITGYDDPETEMEGLRAGADDWLAKPVDLEVLIARLTRLLRRRAIHAA